MNMMSTPQFHLVEDKLTAMSIDDLVAVGERSGGKKTHYEEVRKYLTEKRESALWWLDNFVSAVRGGMLATRLTEEMPGPKLLIELYCGFRATGFHSSAESEYMLRVLHCMAFAVRGVLLETDEPAKDEGFWQAFERICDALRDVSGLIKLRLLEFEAVRT